MGADAEWNMKGDAAGAERLDGPHVEVVVMLVRDEHGVDGRKLGQRQRRPVHPTRADPPRRRRALSPHRIGQDARAIELDERARVSQPGDAQPGGGRYRQTRRRVGHQRQRAGRDAHLLAQQPELERVPVGAPGHQAGRLGVLELAADELPRGAHSLQPLTSRRAAERTEVVGRDPGQDHQRDKQRDDETEKHSQSAAPATGRLLRHRAIVPAGAPLCNCDGALRRLDGRRTARRPA